MKAMNNLTVILKGAPDWGSWTRMWTSVRTATHCSAEAVRFWWFMPKRMIWTPTREIFRETT